MRRLLSIAVLAVIATNCGPPPTTDACKGRTAGDLVLTEFLNDPDGTDSGGEWIEFFNTLGTTLDLKGVTVYTKKLDGSGLKSHVIRAGSVESRGYFVVGDVRSGALPSYVNYAYEGDLGALSNTEGVIGLKCGTVTFDEHQYSVTPKAAHARQLDGRQSPDSVVNDDEGKWCDSPTMLAGTANFGTPGQKNPDCPISVPSGNCIDPGGSASRPVVPPSQGQVFFTEVMADPKAVGDTDGEWLELHSNAEVDLNDVVLTVGTSNKTLTSTTCLHLAAGGYAVLAHETDAGINGGLDNVLATFTATLGNTGGTVTLSVEDAGIDSATYPASLNGIAWQLDPTLLDAVSNDVAASFCAATARYGVPDAGDFGTPGLANTTCGAVTNPSQCLDTGTSTMRPVVRPAAGEVFVTEVMADPKLVGDTAGEWLEVRSNNVAVDLNGVVLTVGASSRTLSSATCLHLGPNGHAVLARDPSAATNGGLLSVMATFTQTLGNSGGTITLGLDDGGIIDTTTFPAAVAGVSSQLDPTKYDSTNNDDPMNYCRATQRYDAVADAGDFGTPAAMNTACPAPVNANQCVDPTSGLPRNVVRPVLGDVVITEFMADPSGTDSNKEYIEIRANAAIDLNGLLITNEGTGSSTVSSQTCLAMPATSFAVLGQSADMLANGGLPVPLGIFNFALTQSGFPRAVAVKLGDGGVLDTFTYNAVTPGASTQLRQGLYSPDDNEDAGSVCVTQTMRYGTLPDGGLGDKGTPGLDNEPCP